MHYPQKRLSLNIRVVALVLPLVALMMRLISESTANASFFILALYAMVGRCQAIESLLLLWIFGAISQGVAPEASALSVSRYIVMAAAAISIAVRSGSPAQLQRISRPAAATLMFGLFLFLHSALFSPVPSVSILKSLSWTLTFVTILSAFQGLTADQRVRVEYTIFGSLAVILMLSVPLYYSPIGYLVNGKGFQGILNQPQAFGSAMALLLVWVILKFLSKSRPSWLLAILLALSSGAVLMSGARTGGVAVVLALFMVFFLVVFVKRKAILTVFPGFKSFTLLIVFFTVVVSLFFAGDFILSKIMDFISKSYNYGEEDVSLVDAYQASRGVKIAEMWSNFLENPIIGNGFGLAIDWENMIIYRDPLFGLPVGVPVEKGVLPLAVLDELGLLGVAAIALWGVRTFARSVRLTGASTGVFFTALLLNLGESTFFSPGGMGLLVLLVLAWTATTPSNETSI